MKVSIVLTVISLTAFGLLLMPVVSPPVRMAGITVAYIPSMASSGLCFYYFYLMPDSRYSLLTTSANSVVGYHMLMATGFYIREMAITFYSTAIKKSWEMNPNVTCSWDLTLFIPPLATASIAQLQVLRLFMTTMPQTFLELNHSFLAYPLVASVPVTSSAVMFIIFHSSGSLCDRLNAVALIHELNLEIDVDKILFASHDPKIVFFGMSVFIEGLIRIYLNWEAIKRAGTKCRAINAIVPAVPFAPSEPLVSVVPAVSLIPIVFVKPVVSIVPVSLVVPEVFIETEVPLRNLVTQKSVQSMSAVVPEVPVLPGEPVAPIVPQVPIAHVVPEVSVVPEVPLRNLVTQKTVLSTIAAVPEVPVFPKESAAPLVPLVSIAPVVPEVYVVPEVPVRNLVTQEYVQTTSAVVPVLPGEPVATTVPAVSQVPALLVASLEPVVSVVLEAPAVPVVPVVTVAPVVPVAPVTPVTSTANPQQMASQYESSKPNSDLYANSPMIIVIFIILSIVTIFSLTSTVTFFLTVIRSFYLWILPIFWISKQEIRDFGKFKYNQMKVRLGFF